jgi:hypothetical protein
MTTKELIHGNKLIAEYYEHIKFATKNNNYVIDDGKNNIRYFDWTDAFNYHESWSKLIPATKKVMTELWENDKIKHPDTSVFNNLRLVIPELEIEKVFTATVEGIKLLNRINETNTEIK